MGRTPQAEGLIELCDFSNFKLAEIIPQSRVLPHRLLEFIGKFYIFLLKNPLQYDILNERKEQQNQTTEGEKINE